MAAVFELKGYTDTELTTAFRRVDTDRSGYIVAAELRDLLREVLSKEPSDYQVRTLMSFFDDNKDGRISLAEFKRGMSQVGDHMLKQVKSAKGSSINKETVGGCVLFCFVLRFCVLRFVRPMTLSLLVAARPPPTQGMPSWAPQPAKAVIGDNSKSSTQMHDVGTYGHDPRKRPVTDGTGMYGTSRDLYEGTVRVVLPRVTRRCVVVPSYDASVLFCRLKHLWHPRASVASSPNAYVWVCVVSWFLAHS